MVQDTPSTTWWDLTMLPPLWTTLSLDEGQDFLAPWDNWIFPDGKKGHSTKPESLLHLLLILYAFLLCLPTSNYKSKSWCYAFTASSRRERILVIPAISSNTCKREEETDWPHSSFTVRFTRDGTKLLLIDSVIRWCNPAATCCSFVGSGCTLGETSAPGGQCNTGTHCTEKLWNPFLCSFHDSARQS